MQVIAFLTNVIAKTVKVYKIFIYW